MQKGIATLEVILGTLIIALLLSAAIPNVTRILDRVALDYETKKLYSDLKFLQAMNRSNKFKLTIGTGGGLKNYVFSGEPISMQLNKKVNSYQILRGTVPLREAHYMQNIKTFAINVNIEPSQITFNSHGRAMNIHDEILRSCTLTLTSRLGKSSSIVFDSVGRIRGGRVADN